MSAGEISDALVFAFIVGMVLSFAAGLLGWYVGELLRLVGRRFRRYLARLGRSL